MQRTIDAGLLLSGPAFIQGTVGASTLAGPFARIEAGARLLPPLSAFAFGQWTPTESSTGAGLRWTF